MFTYIGSSGIKCLIIYYSNYANKSMEIQLTQFFFYVFYIAFYNIYYFYAKRYFIFIINLLLG